MKRMTGTEGRSLIEQFTNSGLCPSQFCKQYHVRYHTLNYWRHRVVEITQKSGTNVTQFVQVVNGQPKKASSTNPSLDPNGLDHNSAAAVILFPNQIRMAIGSHALTGELIEALAQC